MILRLGREAIPEKIAEIPDPYNLRGLALRLLERQVWSRPDRKWPALMVMRCDFMPYQCQAKTFLLKPKHLWAPDLGYFRMCRLVFEVRGTSGSMFQ